MLVLGLVGGGLLTICSFRIGVCSNGSKFEDIGYMTLLQLRMR